MKIVVVGGTGTIGRAIVKELEQRHEVISVGHTHGDLQVDITKPSSIQKMYEAIGKVDAIVSATGSVHFEEFSKMTADKYAIGLQNKLMGQVNLVLLGQSFLNDAGSFTLTSGILSRDPIIAGSSAAMVNGALDAFVKSASIELPRHLRINCVSPTILLESMPRYAPYFRGFVPVAAEKVGLAYSKSVEGAQTGQTYYVE